MIANDNIEPFEVFPSCSVVLFFAFRVFFAFIILRVENSKWRIPSLNLSHRKLKFDS